MLANIGKLNYWVCLKHNGCTKMGWVMMPGAWLGCVRWSFETHGVKMVGFRTTEITVDYSRRMP